MSVIPPVNRFDPAPQADPRIVGLPVRFQQIFAPTLVVDAVNVRGAVYVPGEGVIVGVAAWGVATVSAKGPEPHEVAHV